MSFYDRSKKYLQVVYPEEYNYYALLPAIQSNINKDNSNQYIKTIFSAHMRTFEEQDKEADALKQATATVYIICKDKEIDIGIGNNLKDAIYADLKDVVGVACQRR